MRRGRSRHFPCSFSSADPDSRLLAPRTFRGGIWCITASPSHRGRLRERFPPSPASGISSWFSKREKSGELWGETRPVSSLLRGLWTPWGFHGRQTHRYSDSCSESVVAHRAGRRPQRQTGLQFCRAVHREQTLRFPSKRQHKRLSEAWHCFPGNALGFQAARGFSIALPGVAGLGRILYKRYDPFTSPGRSKPTGLRNTGLGSPLHLSPVPCTLYGKAWGCFAVSLANTCHMPLEVCV